jgi:hypothetical protein
VSEIVKSFAMETFNEIEMDADHTTGSVAYYGYADLRRELFTCGRFGS